VLKPLVLPSSSTGSKEENEEKEREKKQEGVEVKENEEASLRSTLCRIL